MKTYSNKDLWEVIKYDVKIETLEKIQDKKLMKVIE